MKRFVRVAALVLVVLLIATYAGVKYAHRESSGHPSAYTPADTALRKSWLFYYPARADDKSATAPAPKGFIALFGNDVAFWAPHQDLAWRLSGDGYAVVGIDIRKFLGTLPKSEPQRDSAFAVAMPQLLAATRHAMGADSLPMVVGGHSFGAELAFWVALHTPPPRLVGVLALNTRASGHLYITADDWLNKEASGAWSFSTVQAAHDIDPRVKIALVRGGSDPFRKHDAEFEAAAGKRLEHFLVPMAAHSLKTMLTAGPVISRAVRFLFDTTTT